MKSKMKDLLIKKLYDFWSITDDDKKKLLEEYHEAIASSSKDRLEELADMLEVMISLASLENATLEDIIKIADKKRNKRGGFKEKIFLESVM